MASISQAPSSSTEPALRDPRSNAGSRPLSEITENDQHRRGMVSSSNRSSLHKDKDKSRPVSTISVSEESPKKTSAGMGMGVQTITLNLVEYAKSQSQSQSTPTPMIQMPPQTEQQNHNDSDKIPPPPSPTTKPQPPELPKRHESVSLTKGKEKEKKGSPKLLDKDLPETGESSRSGVSSFLLAKRASLRPSSLTISYAEVAKPVPSPSANSATITAPTASASAFDSVDSLRTSSSGADITSKPVTKSKPSWLRRASGTAALRSKSRTPPPKDDSSLPTSTSLPPALPARKGLEPHAEVPTSQSLPEEGLGMAPPPFPPRKSSYANVTAAGPSRSRLGEGQGRPAFSPSSSGGPPPLPSRDNIGNIRGKIAAWTAAAAQSSSGFSRSESSASIHTQSQSGSGGSGFGPQRLPASAQRVLGHAGSAVQKGWAGLRSRGVGGSISSMSSLGQSSRRNGNELSFEPSSSWGSGLNRGSRDRSRSDNYEFGHGHEAPTPDGPTFESDTIKRSGDGTVGKVFGRDVVDSGKEWGIFDDTIDQSDLDDYEKRRRKCLPAVVIRSVEYLQIWGPKEEGIFRISGRSSHIAKLRKEFDSGADIDLTKCHPGDLDPHAVAGLFKSYLRELPSPLLTHDLAPRFDSYIKGKGKATNRATFVSMAAEDGHSEQPEDLKSLLQQLPQAHWFLLADTVKLLDLIPRHSSTNRMTQNALMLSLGPSLNIPGAILSELIERREDLFANPPSPSALETAEALIDFGDVSIPPVTPLTERSSTPVSSNTDDHPGPPSYMGSTKSKKGPRIPAKPSLTRLFTSSSHTSLPRQKSIDTLNSILSPEPPRVEVPISPASPLPSFEASRSEDTTPKALPAPLILSTATAENVPIPETPIPNSDISSSDKIEEIHYSSGTVDERSKLFSTPIADRFQNTSSPFPSLRHASEGNLSKVALVEHSPNPVNVIRRGAPVFFSSAAVLDRHSSTSGGGHKRSASASATATLSNANTSGLKRKDSEEDGSTDGNGKKNEDEDGREQKRLSAGPDSLNLENILYRA
ncbi:hypothetical protein I203_101383 [Kwoniella mangroviensis CBS 8507]|uniref:uncharacterized protein n=1 Tax=Kwoniella mangroviensis CBS 8507 TaxID=1296122 RepID=UPI00080D4D12|nr:uncharacterized protein I203_03020 [Kwoniella mangroviensis CBS 8507]OCF68352.1 hypothetical protein I203_03020 [Kwoniella mangroviensis CBS 8507]